MPLATQPSHQPDFCLHVFAWLCAFLLLGKYLGVKWLDQKKSQAFQLREGRSFRGSWFSSSHRRTAYNCNSSSRGSNDPFCLHQHQACTWYRHTLEANTQTHTIIKYIFKKKKGEGRYMFNLRQCQNVLKWLAIQHPHHSFEYQLALEGPTFALSNRLCTIYLYKA